MGPILVRDTDIEKFDNALHAGYEGLNGLEKPFAKALDRTGLTWARNLPRTGYGILLISIGDTDNFYPDFVVWSGQDVLLIDTKGAQLLREDAGRKLLTVRPRTDAMSLKIRFVSAGEINGDFEKHSPDGFTLWGLKDDGKLRAQYFADLDALLAFATQVTVPTDD